jgi:ATP-dependent exoDNAse (exonuclease V) alpha subunit
VGYDAIRVFNGDIGQIVKIDPVEREVTIRFDQRETASTLFIAVAGTGPPGR